MKFIIVGSIALLFGSMAHETIHVFQVKALGKFDEVCYLGQSSFGAVGWVKGTVENKPSWLKIELPAYGLQWLVWAVISFSMFAWFNHIEEHDMELNGKQLEETSEEVAEIKKLWEKGYTYRCIGKKMDRDSKTVRKIVRLLGFER